MGFTLERGIRQMCGHRKSLPYVGTTSQGVTWMRAGRGDGRRGGHGEGIEPPKNSPPPNPRGWLQAGAGVREPATEKPQ